MAAAKATPKKKQNRRDLIWFTASEAEMQEILSKLDPESVLYARLRLKLLESTQ